MVKVKQKLAGWFQRRVEGIIPRGKFWYVKLFKLYFYVACLAILIRAMFFYP